MTCRIERLVVTGMRGSYQRDSNPLIITKSFKKEALPGSDLVT